MAQGIGGQISNHGSVLDNEDAVAHMNKLGKIRGDHNNACPVKCQFIHEVIDFNFSYNINALGRFVKYIDTAMGVEALGNYDFLLIAIAHMFYAAVGIFYIKPTDKRGSDCILLAQLQYGVFAYFFKITDSNIFCTA